MNAGLAHTDLVVRSLETAATRCDDLTPAVYARLFAAMPDVRPLFRKEAKLVQGEMLARAIEAILDYCGPRAYGANLVMSEVVNHAAYDLPPQAFSRFFGFVADAVRDVIGPDWTAETAAAWKAMIEEISAEAAAAS
ncbi:MAG: globin [Beijerinckiaceae bacterium]